MNMKSVLIILTIIQILNGDSPEMFCLPEKPFQRSDKSCGDFNDICVKKDDLLCNNFQAACQQCPPTNFTVYVLLHLNDKLNRSNVNQNEIKNQINISNSQINVSLNRIVKKSTDQIGILAACLIFIILIFIFAIYIFWKNKYVKMKKRRKSSGGEMQALIENKQVQYADNRTLLQKMINEKNITKLLQNIKEMINEKDHSALDSVVCYKLKFQIVNQFDETEIFVSKFHSVIKLKKSICDRNMNMNDYKRMIMKYKGVTLDNNQFLLSSIDSTNIPIFCEFDKNVDVDTMIIIKLKCDNIYLEMLQIWKHQTLKDLKIMISKLNKTNFKDLLIFYKCKELDDDDKTIDDYKIEDDDYIIVVYKFDEMQNISMKSIFTDKETISIEISKFEKVSDIISKSIQKIQPKMATNHCSVFLNNKLLENEKFIYEYNIDSKSLVEFCYFKSMEEIEAKSNLICSGHINLFKAKNNRIDRMILLKSYSIKYMNYAHNNDLSRVLKEDLQMFQITKYHSRFIQMFGIYMDEDWVYVGLENSIMDLMSTFLTANNEIPTYEMSKWAYQMLEGLKHLHSHNIIMKDMNPTNIWINGNHDVKLPSFNMTYYLEHLDDDKKKTNPTEKVVYKKGNLTYVAPEILEGKPYDKSVDVWSLGVIMIEVVTRGIFYPELTESEIVQKIKESHTIEYDKTNKPEDLINFIDCCVRGDPKERSTIDQLMKHEFIEKYLLFSD